MTLLKAQITLPFFSAIPTDVASNSLYFNTESVDPTANEYTEIAARITAAYNVIDTYISPVVNPRQGTIKIYNMTDPTPRQPVGAPFNMPIGPGGSGTGLPNEVAVVLSYQRTLTSGQPPARSRGRIYIGPLGSIALTMGTSTSFPTVALNFRNDLATFAQTLATPIIPTFPLHWVQYSPSNQTSGSVTSGWIDNDFDTQRRRGFDASVRTVFAMVQ